MAADDKQYQCPEPGCDYSAKTSGAITQHVNRSHGNDPLAAVRNGIGSGAPRPGGAFASDPIKSSPSGIPSVDYAIGIGGLPKGGIVEIFGEPACGKTTVAMTFAGYSQYHGRRAGLMDAEKVFNERFPLIGHGLDLEQLEYGRPPDYRREEDPATRKKMKEAGWDGSGEAALEASRRFIDSGLFDVWTVDSVHACQPREVMELPIGDPRARAALARLFNQALGVMAAEIEYTDTTAIFVNHVKTKPGVSFGRDWSKPAGSAFDYYASVQLHVSKRRSFRRKEDNRIFGHVVNVRVHKSKVAMPHASADFDLFYGEGTVQADPTNGVIERPVTVGVDVSSSWMSVMQEEGAIRASGGRYFDAMGEALGTKLDVLKMLADPDTPLFKQAHSIVYKPDFVSDAA